MDGNYPHFTQQELACSCCGAVEMDSEFMERVEKLRVEFGEPMIITSGYRCQAYNTKIGGGSAHPAGQAIDVAIHGARAWRLLRLALGFGFVGIGLNQKGPIAGRFIHIDNCTNCPARPGVWTY